MSWNHPKEEVKSHKKKPPKLSKGILAGLVVAILASAVFYFIMGRGNVEKGDQPERRRSKIAEKQPAEVPKIAKSGVRKERVKPKTVADAVAQVVDQPKPAMKIRQLSPEEWDRLTNRTFSTGTEQLMSWVFSVHPGDMPMPIPNISEEDRKNLAAILISKNKITERDDEKTAFCKEQVDLAKKEMAKYIGEGGDPDDFLQYYFQELKLAFDKRNDAINTLQETFEEDPELAEQMREAINKKFEEDGIRPINKEAIQ